MPEKKTVVELQRGRIKNITLRNNCGKCVVFERARNINCGKSELMKLAIPRH